MDTRHLTHLLPGSVDLCDLILVAGQTKFPVHSAYLASHSEIIRQFCLDVGPFSWKAPQVIQEPLQDHSSDTVHYLLSCVYGGDDVQYTDLEFTDPWLAWDLYKLSDQLHCPKILDVCVEYLNTIGIKLLTKSAKNAVQCLLGTGNVPRLSELHQACTAAIAAAFQAVANDKGMLQLPRDVLVMIMQAMATRMVKLEILTSAAETASRKRKRLRAPILALESSSEGF